MAFPTLILQASTVRGSSSNFQAYLFSSALLVVYSAAELVHRELDFLQDFIHYLAPQPSVCGRGGDSLVSEISVSSDPVSESPQNVWASGFCSGRPLEYRTTGCCEKED